MMSNIRTKTALWVILIVSFLIFYAIYRVQGSPGFNLRTIFQILPKVLSIDLVLFSLFVSFLWKFPIFKHWLVPFPNLNGTWKGHIHTTWIAPKTGDRPDPIPAILTIKQSFLKVSCVMKTGEMTSRSLVGGFLLDNDNQLKRLYYIYDSNPIETVKERSPEHSGTMSFDISEESETGEIVLTGSYWTGRKTTGHIEMRFWKKEIVDRYPEELGAHPVSEVRVREN